MPRISLRCTDTSRDQESSVKTKRGKRYVSSAGDVALLCANGWLRWFGSRRAGPGAPSQSLHCRRRALLPLPSRRGRTFPPTPTRGRSSCSTAPSSTSVRPASPPNPTASATAAGVSYPALGAVEAYSELIAARAGFASQASQCPTARPFVIKDVRWRVAGFATDRGTMPMSAWLFDISEIDAYLGYSALEPSAFWGNGVSPQGMMGGRISADGLTLTLGTVGGPETPGPGVADLSASAAESSTAVAVAIAPRFHTPPAGEGCTLEGHVRTVAVRLSRPLGGRVVIDAKGDAGAVCVEGAAC